MIEILNMEQGTPEWFEARLGIPTASCFDIVMMSGRGNAPSKTRQTYMRKLAGEKITRQPMDSYSNHHMERGKEMESEGRGAYAFAHDVIVEQVGFIRNHGAGCSPDGLIGDVGMTEIKTKLAHLQIEVLLEDRLPPEHKAQVQGQLWVAEREWCDFVSYWPGLPLFVKRVYRDEPYIKQIAAAVDEFNEELAGVVARIEELRCSY